MYLHRLSFNELNSNAGDESSHYLKLLAIHLPYTHCLDCTSLPLDEWVSLWPLEPTASSASAAAAAAAAAAPSISSSSSGDKQHATDMSDGQTREPAPLNETGSI